MFMQGFIQGSVQCRCSAYQKNHAIKNVRQGIATDICEDSNVF